MSTLLTGKLGESFLTTRDQNKGMGYFEDTAVLEYAYTDTALEIDVAASPGAPVYLVEILHLVRTAFAGGAPAINIGDGTTTNKYIAAASINQGTVGDLQSSVATQKIGAKLVATGRVVVTLSGGLTAGAGTLIVRTYRVGP